MNKKILLLPLLTLFLASCGSTTGGASEDTLKIGCVQLGYGTEWLTNIVKAYEQKTNTKVSLKTQVGKTGMAALNTPVNNGSSEYDLIFNKRGTFEYDCLVGDFVAADKTIYPCTYADITDVYDSIVDPNTNMTIRDKMLDIYRDYYNFADKDGNAHYYGMPWANGIIGIVRNKTVWDRYFPGEEAPLTTNQLFEYCANITNPNVSGFIYSSQDEYYSGWLNIFLAQYRGVTDFMANIMEGKSLDEDGNYTVCRNFFYNEGMLETLEVIEQLLNPDNGYQHKMSTSLTFTQMQHSFLSGEALFSVNGSWLEFEGDLDKSSNIDYIKTPIISSIVKRLSFGNSALSAETKDEKLQTIIRYVDGTGPKPAGVTEQDIEIIREARKASHVESGLDHECFIPCASKNIDKAKDFLKFMYSDEGLNIYHETMKGATLPAVTSTGEYKTDMTSEMSIFRKSINKEVEQGDIVRLQTKAKFFRLGNVVLYYSNSNVDLVNGFATKTATPLSVLEANRAYVDQTWDDIQSKIF